MEQLVNISKCNTYDTTINIIGGLKDCSVIYESIDSFFQQDDSLGYLTSKTNDLDLRTERSRIRIGRAIKESFLSFYNQDHCDLIQGVFKSQMPYKERELILFWQFSLNNRLFRDISTELFFKIYFSGRTVISKEDITGYLKELVRHEKSLNWTESTIATLSTKYLNFMTKLNILNRGRSKCFNYVKPTGELLVIFLYIVKLYKPNSSNILTNSILPLSFIQKEDLSERLKKLSLKGFFNMSTNGVALNIELTNSYREICNVLYN